MATDLFLLSPPRAVNVISDLRLQNSPLSLIYLAGYLRHRGHSVILLDAYTDNLSIGDSVKAIVKARPRVLGITCDSTRVSKTRRVLREVKEALPDTLTVLGGYFPTYVQEVFHPLADVIVHGEGEHALARIVERALGGGGLEDVPGLYLLDDKGYHPTEKAPFIEDLDEIFHPAWDLAQMENNFHFWAKRSPEATLVLSRGCPATCIFCPLPNLFGRQVRRVSVERSLDELTLLKEKHHIKEIYFKDNLFVGDHEWTTALCQGMIDRKLKLTWCCGTSIKSVNPQILAIMAKAGCHMINFGIESGDNETLKRIGKQIVVDDVLKANEMVRAAGINAFNFFIIGFPWETREQIERTIDLARKTVPHNIMFSILSPTPGTPIWKRLKLDEKVAKGEVNWSDLNWFHKDVSFCENLTMQELLELKQRAFRTVQTPGYWMRYLLHSSPSSLTRQVRRKLQFRKYQYGATSLAPY